MLTRPTKIPCVAGNKILNNGLCLLVLVSESDVLAAATSVLLSDLFRLRIADLQFLGVDVRYS